MINPKWLDILLNETADSLIEGKQLIVSLKKKRDIESVYRAHFLAGKFSGLIKAVEVAVSQKISKDAHETLILLCEEMTIVGIELQLFNVPLPKHGNKPNLN